MALFPRPLCYGLLFLRLWLLYSSSPKKVSLGGVLDRCLYMASSTSSEEDSDPSDDCLCCVWHNFFFNSSISRYMSFSFFAWETWLFPRDWPLLVCVVCPLPSWSPLCWGFTTELLCCEPPDSAWSELSLPWYGPIVGWCEPDSSIFSTKPKSLSDQIKPFSQTAPIVRTGFDSNPKTGMDLGPTSPNNKFIESGRKS